MPAEGRKCVWTWQSGLVVLIWGAFACRTSAQSIEDSASGPQLRFPEPGPKAEVVLWEQRGFSGRSVRLECCGETDLQAPLKAAGLRSPQSVSVTAGLHAVFYTRPYRFSASGTSRSFDAFGNLSSLMDIFPLSEETCCSSVRVSKAARLHDEETSVFVYSDEGFRGEVAAYAEGDHGGLPFPSIGSARVPAGFRASFHYGTSFGSVFSEPDIVLNRDSHRFPDEDTSTTKNKRRLSSIPVQGISVRRVQPEHLHGLFVYFEPGFRGRAQFLGAGEHYNYPDSWSQVKSLRPTNWTYGRLLTSQGPSEIHEPTEGLEGNQTQPHAIEVKARCEPEDYCGRNGRCTAPQRCSCEGDFTGSRCHLMEPDGTSAIVCEHNAIVLGEALACWLLPRHENAPCNASSVLVRVDLAEELAGSAELFGSPLIKGRWGVVKAGQEDYDSDAFRFEVVFNKTGRFQEPVSLTVLRRPVAGAHVPQLEVLERCDRPDAAAAVRCGSAEDVGGQSRHNCTLSTTLGGAPLRCPRRALRLQLLGKGGRQEPLQLQGEDLGPASDSFAFWLDATQARPGFKRTRFRLEVSHGADAQVVPIIMVQAKKEQAPLPSHSLRARELLQRGDVAGAMALLEACKGTPSCLRLRAELLSRLGRFAEAERTYNTLGNTRHSSRLATARAATAAVVAATERGDYEAAKRDLQPALEAAPLSARLWVLSAEAALQEGDFDLAADHARHAHRLGGVAAAEARRSIDVSTLEALGFALLGIGLADVAQQNFLGCAELEGASAGEHHRLLASEVASLRSAARLLDERVRSEAWTSAAPLAERLIQEHGARWPAFSESLWNLQAQSALCRARGSLRANRTDLALDSVLGPCNAVVQARTAMLVRLPLEQLLRCHVTLAEALEDTGDAAAALLQADAAEALVKTAAEGELLEALSSEVKLLRARLTKTVRRRPKAKQEGRQPTNHYEVLGIPRDATAAQVKSAYRRLALKYHPDKNPDPEAVQIFLDVQQAYQVLSDETLRKLYDEGHTVDEEAGAKNVKPMRYRVRIDRLRGVKVVWWYDPSTGEEGFMEIPLTKEEMRFETPKKPGHRELRKHCCLPSSDAGAAKG